MRKAFCFLTILLVCFLFSYSQALSSDEYVDGDYTFSVLEDNTLRITKYSGNAESLLIPSENGGRTVTSIGNYAFGGCRSLTSAIIPNTVTTIGNQAFGLCDKLTSVTIPDSVTQIGEKAFQQCMSLSSIELPDSVVQIGDNASPHVSS